jgi:hypothetical protein
VLISLTALSMAVTYTAKLYKHNLYNK